MKQENVPQLRKELAALRADVRQILERVEAFAGVIADPHRDDAGRQTIPEGGRVRIIRIIDDAKEVRGREGVALAGSADPAGVWNYTVSVDGLNETYVLPGSALQFLGWTVPARLMYGKPAFSVVVDEEGNGSVARRSRKRRK